MFFNRVPGIYSDVNTLDLDEIIGYRGKDQDIGCRSKNAQPEEKDRGRREEEYVSLQMEDAFVMTLLYDIHYLVEHFPPTVPITILCPHKNRHHSKEEEDNTTHSTSMSEGKDNNSSSSNNNTGRKRRSEYNYKGRNRVKVVHYPGIIGVYASLLVV